MARDVAIIVRLCEVSSCKISHFGINPVSGGSPPNDISRISVREAVVGEVVHVVVISLMVFDEVEISTMNVETVIRRYSARFSSIMLGANVRIVAIQPRWAIDEYAMIFRVCVWLRPPHPPTSVDRMPIVSRVAGCSA